jgi:hypothetical protein
MPIKPKTKPLVSKSDRVLRPRARKEHLQPVVEVVLEVEGRERLEDSMSEGSKALGVGWNRQPPDRGPIEVEDDIHVGVERPEF